MAIIFKCDRCGKEVPEGDYFSVRAEQAGLGRDGTPIDAVGLCRNCLQNLAVELRRLFARFRSKEKE